MESKDELTSNLIVLLNRIKTFSCPEYKDVYTKSYFEEVVKPIITNPENTYSFIFGDFNKLGVINDVHGHDFGNRVLEIAMRIIKKSLPNDSLIVRAGGDEIYIVLPNSNKEIADKYIAKINNNLQQNAVTISGLSIELASSDSTYGDIDSLIKITDNEVNNIKAARKESNSPADILADDFLDLQIPKSVSSQEEYSWNELNDFINISIYEFLKNFRPSKNFEFNPQQIVDSADFVTNSFLCLLNDKLDNQLPKNFESLMKNDYPYSPNYDNIINNKNKKNNLSTDDAILINALMVRKKGFSDLNDFSEDELKKLIHNSENLLDQLTKDHTGLLNKHYFRLSLAQQICNSNEKYSASYVSFSGLKLSNTAYDHIFSDYRLDKSNKLLIDETSKLLNYTNTAFDFNSRNIYMISQGGGNYLYLYPKSMSKDIKPKISSIVNKINDKVNIKDPNSYLETSYYSMSDTESLPTSSSKQFIRYIRALKEETNSNKNSFKKNLFKSADAYFAFKKSMSNCVDYYIENIDNSGTDLNKMVQFMRNVYTSFLNQEVLHNDNRKDMPKTGFIAYKEEQNDTSNQCSEIEH